MPTARPAEPEPGHLETESRRPFLPSGKNRTSEKSFRVSYFQFFPPRTLSQPLALTYRPASSCQAPHYQTVSSRRQDALSCKQRKTAQPRSPVDPHQDMTKDKPPDIGQPPCGRAGEKQAGIPIRPAKVPIRLAKVRKFTQASNLCPHGLPSLAQAPGEKAAPSGIARIRFFYVSLHSAKARKDCNKAATPVLFHDNIITHKTLTIRITRQRSCQARFESRGGNRAPFPFPRHSRIFCEND